MKVFRMCALAAPFALFAATGAFAAPETYTFDKNHTEIRFCWNHLGFSRQCGHFLDYDGELIYDAEHPENSTLTVTFKTDSIETLVPILNEHMKGEKLFDVKNFPEATFKSTKFEKISDKTGNVTGDLTIKGVTKPVVLAVTLNQAGVNPMTKKETLGVAVSTSVNRADFNVSQAVPFVSAEVAIEVQSELTKKD